MAEGWAALERRAHGQEAAEAERDALAKLARKLEDRVREKDALVARALEESQATLEDARAMGHRVKELEGEAAERLADAEEAARRESRALQEQVSSRNKSYKVCFTNSYKICFTGMNWKILKVKALIIFKVKALRALTLYLRA